ncbi:uncharacterized protein BX664DRAFT_360143 [Halteromyces radiatus]|uniref:uncharacterized protein n=1 Tax=Halteromyces radiatus TaxID=101107 RepID=UPI00221F147D|nr:uncharacterized protein BX664DRAFT_360143 [Halteromyces radiatus]KAI8086629.1 hypothetical protein BX664DRAFT_360143 [Halteromyces radiatus]
MYSQWMISVKTEIERRLCINKRNDDNMNQINHVLKKDKVQQGLTLMELAILETQEQTSLQLYSIALNKFISAHPSSFNDNSIYHHQKKKKKKKQQNDVIERTIWTQCLSVLVECLTLIIMVFHKTPLPENKYHVIQYGCHQLGQCLYLLIDGFQRYDLPRYVAQIIYIITMTIIYTGKTCMESNT